MKMILEVKYIDGKIRLQQNGLEIQKKNEDQLFNILEELCKRIYDIGYEDGFDDGEF